LGRRVGVVCGVGNPDQPPPPLPSHPPPPPTQLAACTWGGIFFLIDRYGRTVGFDGAPAVVVSHASFEIVLEFL